MKKKNFFYFPEKYMNNLFTKNSIEYMGLKLTYFLATGNLVSNTGLDLMQVLII